MITSQPNATYPAWPRGMVARQRGATFQSERTGLATAREKFLGYYDDMINGIPLTIYGSTEATSRSYKTANPFHPSLLVYSSKITLGSGILNGMLDIEYRGLDPALGSIPPPVYSLDKSTSTESLETNPKFKTEIAGTPSAPKNGAFFWVPGKPGVVSTDNATGLFSGWTSAIPAAGAADFRGQDSYLKAGSVWTASYVSYSQPSSADLDNVGYISNPDGSPPTPPGYIWLYLGCKFTDNAGLFRIDKSWRLFVDNPASRITYTPAY